MGVSPQSLAFSPDGKYAYVTNNGNGVSANRSITVINTATKTVVTTMLMPVPPRYNGADYRVAPAGVAFSPSGAYAYVAGQGTGGGITVIDSKSMINLANNPYGTYMDFGYQSTINPYYPTDSFDFVGVAFNPSGTLAYAIDSLGSSVKVIDTQSNSPITSIPLGTSVLLRQRTSDGYTSPQYVAFSPSGAYAYVTDDQIGPTGSQTGSISVIDVSSNTVVANIGVGSEPYGVTFSPSGSYAYVADYGSDEISVINTQSQQVSTIPIGPGTAPIAVAINHQDTLAYVVDYGVGKVSIVSLATNMIIENITVGLNPTSIAISPSGTYAYVTNQGSYTVSIIPVAANMYASTAPTPPSLTSIPLWGTNPTDIAINPAGTLAFVTNYGSDGGTPSPTPSTPISSTGSYGAAFNPKSNQAYIANYWDGTVTVVDTTSNSTINTFPVGSHPIGIVVNPAGTYAYVAAGGTIGTVNVIKLSTETVVKTIPGVSVPQSIAISPSGNVIYVTNYAAAGTVSVISTVTNTLVKTVNVGGWPQGVTFNPSGTLAYVYNLNIQGNGNPAPTVSVINTATYAVTSASASTYPGTIDPVTGLGFKSEGVNGPVAIYDPITNTILATIPQASPTSISIDPSGTLAYVTSQRSNTAVYNLLNIDQDTEPSVSIINLAASSAIGVLPYPLSFIPGALSFASTGTAYVATPISYPIPTGPTLSTEALVASIGAPSGPLSILSAGSTGSTIYVTMPSIAASPSSSYAYAIELSGFCGYSGAYYGCTGGPKAANITAINTATGAVASTLTIGGSPTAMVLNPAGTKDFLIGQGPQGGRGYVSSFSVSGSSLSSINSVTIGDNTGSGPLALAVNPTNQNVYVTDTKYNGCGGVATVNPTTLAVSNQILTGDWPDGIAINPAGTRAYVANLDSSTISVINLATNSVINVLSVPFNPTNLTISTNGQTLYALGQNYNNVYSIPVGSLPAINPPSTS